MVSTPPIPRQELIDASGQAFAFIVSAEEMARLTGELTALHEQLAEARRQRDQYRADIVAVWQAFAPPPPTPEEWREAMADPRGHHDLLSQLGEGT